jgi:uncharacterized protein
MKIERRTFRVKEMRVNRAAKDGPPKIIGHAAVFNSPTDMGWFTEQVAPGFFKNALATSDVRMLFNHDPNYVLGRTKAGTLRLEEDDVGLLSENDLPDTQFARDLAVSIERGDIDQMSFAWTTKADKWEKLDDGTFMRTLLEAEEIFDTSVVTYPAYEATDVSVAKRSYDHWKEQVERRGAIAYSRHGDLPKMPENDSWDASAAESRIAKWASSDGSGDKEKIDWKKYAEGFAWFDETNPEDFGSYKLPHHDIRDGQIEHHWRGIVAAMAALLGSRGGTDIPEGDREAVYNHLKTEYGRYNKTAPDFRTIMALPGDERVRIVESVLGPSPELLAAIAAEARLRELRILAHI